MVAMCVSLFFYGTLQSDDTLASTDFHRDNGVH